MFGRLACVSALTAALALSQTADSTNLKQRENAAAPANTYVIAPGTHVLLRVVNGVSSKSAAVGTRVYMRTAYPVIANGHIVIPEGSYVNGTVTQVKRAGRMRGKGELSLQFDNVVLPNGVSRDLRSNLGDLDSSNSGTLNRETNTIEARGGKEKDAGTIAGTTAGGTIIGATTGSIRGATLAGAGIGAGVGAAAGLATVLATRGPEATLSPGSTLEMVLDRPISFSADELATQTVVHEQVIQVPVPASEGRRTRGFTPFPE